MVKCEDTNIIILSVADLGAPTVSYIEFILQIVVVKFVFTPKLRCL